MEESVGPHDGKVRIALRFKGTNNPEPEAYIDLTRYDDFLYVENVKVQDKYRGLGYGSDLLRKASEYIISQGVPGLGYNERPQGSPAYDMREGEMGWINLDTYPPWAILLPKGVSMPSDQAILSMILTARPDYQEYLNPLKP